MLQTLAVLEPGLLAVIAASCLLGLGLLYAAWRGLRGGWRSRAVPRAWIDFRSRFGTHDSNPGHWHGGSILVSGIPRPALVPAVAQGRQGRCGRRVRDGTGCCATLGGAAQSPAVPASDAAPIPRRQLRVG